MTLCCVALLTQRRQDAMKRKESEEQPAPNVLLAALRFSASLRPCVKSWSSLCLCVSVVKNGFNRIVIFRACFFSCLSFLSWFHPFRFSHWLRRKAALGISWFQSFAFLQEIFDDLFLIDRMSCDLRHWEACRPRWTT